MPRKKEPYTIVKPAAKGGAFRYRLGSDVKRRLKSTGKITRREAVLFCEELLKHENRGEQTFRQYSKDFFLEKCPCMIIKRRTGTPFDDRTAKDYRSRLEHYLLPAFGDIAIEELSVSHWDRWLDDLEAGKILTNSIHPHRPAYGTINHIRRTLIEVLDVAVRERIISVNFARLSEPMSQKIYKHRDVLNDDEIAILFPVDEVALKKTWGSTERVALFCLLLTSGMRSGELQALKWNQICFNEGGIIIDKAKKYCNLIGEPKGEESRAFPLPELTMLRLAKWKDESLLNSEDDYVFYSTNMTDGIRGDTMLKVFKRVLKANKIGKGKNIVIHSLRHTFTTAMAENVPIQTVMAFTGHKSIKMVERYSHENMKNKLINMKNKFDTDVSSIWDSKIKNSKNDSAKQSSNEST